MYYINDFIQKLKFRFSIKWNKLIHIYNYIEIILYNKEFIIFLKLYNILKKFVYIKLIIID